MTELKPCPFCGGKAHISEREMRYYGINDFGCRKIKFGAQAMCNKCRARGGVVTAIIITDRKDTNEQFDKLDERAIEAWNRRVTDDKTPPYTPYVDFGFGGE